MSTMAATTILEPLVESADAVVYRGREGDRAVLLRMPRSPLPSPAELARLRYGLEVSKGLDLPGVLRVERLAQIDGRTAQVMEDSGALPLRVLIDQGQVGEKDALEIAGQIGRTLGALHERHLVHKNVEPANVFVHLEAGQVRLANFDLASRLTRESPSLVSPGRLEGALAYLSPEQTGRMNRAVDYRTDFYSLGVTLYEMLTGRVPFRAADPMALIHAHIAVQPQPPYLVRPSVPRGASEVVMKLLAKNAEDRYQSAYGLVADLEECLGHVSLLATLSEFVPGRHDVSAELRVPERLYGRQDDAARLLDSFERVASGGVELLLVSGPSGIGKSALVHEIHKPILERRGYFCAGKFDQLQNAPYSAFIQAFRDLVGQILAESEEQIAAWREALLDALGANGQVVVAVVPDVALIIGPQPEPPPLGPAEAQNRFNLAFQQFVGVFARRSHPLALFLDDLQWADTASLNLLQLLLQDTRDRAALLIGAFRPSELEATHPLPLALDEIRRSGAAVAEVSLGPLRLEHVEELLTGALGQQRPRELRDLAELVLRRTEGNALFVRQFLGVLAERGLVAFDAEIGRFRWQIERIREEGVTEGVAGLMAERIRRLPEETRQALQIAASIGASFDLAEVAAVGGVPRAEASIALWPAIEEGLILPIGESYKFVDVSRTLEDLTAALPIRYAFLHDRIQEAAYRQIPEEARPEVHLRVGRRLLERTQDADREARIFDIVNQLDVASALFVDPEERLELARLNLQAGKRAKGSAAYGAARRYLAVGAGLLGERAFDDRYELAFELHRELASCDYLTGRVEEAEAAFARLTELARSKQEKAEIYCLIQEVLHSARADVEGGMRASLTALRLYGVELPEGDAIGPAIGAEAEALAQRLAGRGVLDLVDLPEARDPDVRMRVRLLALASNGAYTNPALFQLVTLRILNASLEHGNCPFSSTGYMSRAVVSAAMGEYDAAYAFGKVALEVSDRYDPPAHRGTNATYFGSFVCPWREPLRTAMQRLDVAYAACLESGNLWFAAIASLSVVVTDYLSGTDLRSLRDRTQRQMDFLRQIKQRDQYHYVIQILRLATLLVDGALPEPAPEHLQEGYLLAQVEHTGLGRALHHIHLLTAAFIEGDLQRARRMADAVEPDIMFVFGHVLELPFRLYQSLTLGALHDGADAEERARLREALARNEGRMKPWSESCPDNFLAPFLLVQAEVARVDGDEERAMELYERAMEAAAAQAHVHVQALAAERAARMILARGRRRGARAYLADAYQAYARWGAEAKLTALRRELGDLLPGEAPSPREGQIDASAAALDLTTVLKASQAISGEIVLDELLRRLMSIVVENAGAQRGLLLLRGDSPILVEAALTPGEGARVEIHASEGDGGVPYARSIARYVERTGERVVLGDAAAAGRFRADEHVDRVGLRSVLCMPVRNQTRLLGILYLENGAVADAFTPERCRVLELLSTQAAISIENARLYDTLENRVKDRTRELRESNHELSQALKRLRETQKQLVTQEKLASLGALTAGIAHEIKNPLNFVNNFAQLSVEMVDELVDHLSKQRPRLDPATLDDIDECLGYLRQNVSHIHEHGRTANSIINGMLLHARDRVGEREEADLNRTVSESVNLAYHGMRGTDPDFELTVDSRYDPDVGKVELAVSDMRRVFINIVNNACYATRQRRRAENHGYTPTLTVATRDRGDAVEVHFKDNGTGIPRDVVGSVFNPFFTTKPPGEGTGLGLSISYDIVVQRHQGDIRVESEPGQYTEIVITLPKRRPAAAG